MKINPLRYQKEMIEMESMQDALRRRINERREQIMRAAVDRWLYTRLSRYIKTADQETGEMLHMLMQAEGITFTMVYPPCPYLEYLEVRRGISVLETTPL